MLYNGVAEDGNEIYHTSHPPGGSSDSETTGLLSDVERGETDASDISFSAAAGPRSAAAGNSSTSSNGSTGKPSPAGSSVPFLATHSDEWYKDNVVRNGGLPDVTLTERQVRKPLQYF